MVKIILTSLIIFSFTFNANAKKKESYYQNIHCDNLEGKAEFKLEDRTRIETINKNLINKIEIIKIDQ